MSPAWPIGGLPENTEYTVWLRAAKLAGTTVRELLEDTLTVQGAAYQRALEDLALDVAAAAHPGIGLTVDRDVLPVMTAEEVAAAMPIAVPSGHRRWELHVSAEATLTEALRLLQDNDVHECMRRLQLAQQQVFEVTVMDKTERWKEGQL